MTALRSLIDKSISAVLSDHPAYLTPRGKQYLHGALLKKLTAAIRLSLSEQNESPDNVVPMVYRSVLVDSPQGHGYRTLRTYAGCVAPRIDRDGTAYSVSNKIPGGILEAFAKPAQQQFVSDRRQVAAWQEFFIRMFGDEGRRSMIVENRGERGLYVPWPWPPRRDGTVSGQDEEWVA